MGSNLFQYDLLSRLTDAEVALVPDSCTQDLHVQFVTYSAFGTEEVCGEITTGPGVRIASSADVTFLAGERIALGSGFRVDSGGRFVAAIDPDIEGNGGSEATWEGSYDRFGNLLSVATQKPGGSKVTRTMGVNAGTNRLSVASYDTSGNVTAWSGRSFRHDPFNMLRETGTHVFLYGPGDERIWTIDWSQGSAVTSWIETWTLRDLDGTPLRQMRTVGGNTASNHWSFVSDFVWRNGGLLAAVTENGTEHYHLDHLGTPRLVTGFGGNVLRHHSYFPFGEEATDPEDATIPLQYTGHERDDLDPGGTTRDLDYMHARYFSANLGRFHSVDPVGAAPSWPQSWNRYSYVLGNPMKYVDPEGLWPFFPVGDFPIASFNDQITTTGTGIPLPFLNFLGFGNFLRNIGFLSDLSSPGSRYTLYQNLHERDDVQRFFACLARQGQSAGFEAAGLIHVTESGDLGFSSRLGQGTEVEIGDVTSPRLIGVAHTHPVRGSTGFIALGNDQAVAIHITGFGGSRVPNYIIHPRGGVTRYLLGVDQAPGTQVLPTNFDRGMRNVCEGVGSF